MNPATKATPHSGVQATGPFLRRLNAPLPLRGQRVCCDRPTRPAAALNVQPPLSLALLYLLLNVRQGVVLAESTMDAMGLFVRIDGAHQVATTAGTDHLLFFPSFS